MGAHGYNIKDCAMMKLLFLLCLGRALAVARGDIADIGNVAGRKGLPASSDDDRMIRRIEEEMLALNKSGDMPRDKRGLGILLQGFMEALGYTVSPVQLGSLANPGAAPMAGGVPAALQMAVAATPQGSMAPMPAPMAMNASAPNPPPRQRETLRFTGVLNFGNHVNTTNLVNHLAQYEQLFHGSPMAAARPPGAAGPPSAAAPPPPAPPKIDPRSLDPLPEPLFVKIPLPIAPNLPPPQPPSPMPIKTAYHDQFALTDHDEEYHDKMDDAGQHGEYEEENNKTHHSEEYENKYDQIDDKNEYDDHKDDEEKEDKNFLNEDNRKEINEPEENNEFEGFKMEHEAEDKNDDYEDKYNEDAESEEKFAQNDKPEKRVYNFQEPTVSYERSKEPREKTTEKEYKKNENVVTYSVENKEIYDPSEVSEEVPIVGSKYDHAMYVGEPNWKKDHEDHIYKLAAEQEARAEALAEENTERENDRNIEHELNDDTVQFHRNREKEIEKSNEERTARYESDSKETTYDGDESESDHHHEASEKENDHKNYDPDNEGVTTTSDKPLSDTQRKEIATEISKPILTTHVPTNRRNEQHLNEDSEEPHKYQNNNDAYQEEKEKRRDYYDALPISYDREKSRQDSTLRDSYGQSLEKPNGKVDDRVASYFSMFKNPETGIYDPSIIKQYESSRVAYDDDNLEKGFKKIQKEYGLPESRYEEYELNEEDGESEHRSSSNKQLPKFKGSKKIYPGKIPTIECDCNTRKGDVVSEEAKIEKKIATTGLPSIRTAEAPINYSPYYTTVKYLYDPAEYDRGIIARLTSYGPPTTAKLEDQTDSIYKPSSRNTQKQQTRSPIQTKMPENLITKRLYPEPELKEIKSWPTTYDYSFGSTENSNIVLRELSQTGIKTTPNVQSSSYHTPFPSTTTNCHEAHTLRPSEFTDRIHVLANNQENTYFNVGNNKNHDHRSENVRSRKQNGITHSTSSYVPTLQTTPPTLFEQRRTPFITERSTNYYDNSGWTTYSPVTSETLTPYPERVRVNKGPTSGRASTARHSDQNAKRTTEKQRIIKIQPTVKKKPSNNSRRPPPMRNRAKEESSNYVERDGMLIIPEPMPYYYNERVNKFTEEPPSETEKVNVKEYRNRIESIKTSRVKQFHPDISRKFAK